jgi:hypothetical protein
MHSSEHKAIHTIMQSKNNWFGGIIMCVFPAMILFLAHGILPLFAVILLSLFILCGVWAIVSSIFRLDADSALSWVVGAMVAAGFAAFAFVIACREKGFRGGIPFIPAAWNQVVARALFAFGGLLVLISAVVFLKKAREKYKQKHDDVA